MNPMIPPPSARPRTARSIGSLSENSVIAESPVEPSENPAERVRTRSSHSSPVAAFSEDSDNQLTSRSCAASNGWSYSLPVGMCHRGEKLPGEGGEIPHGVFPRVDPSPRPAYVNVI